MWILSLIAFSPLFPLLPLSISSLLPPLFYSLLFLPSSFFFHFFLSFFPSISFFPFPFPFSSLPSSVLLFLSPSPFSPFILFLLFPAFPLPPLILLPSIPFSTSPPTRSLHFHCFFRLLSPFLLPLSPFFSDFSLPFQILPYTSLLFANDKPQTLENMEIP